MRSFFDGFFWVDSIVCFYVYCQFFIVGMLINMEVIDSVSYVFDWSVDSIDWNNVNWCIFRQVFVCRNIIVIFGYCQFYFQVNERFYGID